MRLVIRFRGRSRKLFVNEELFFFCFFFLKFLKFIFIHLLLLFYLFIIIIIIILKKSGCYIDNEYILYYLGC